MYETNFHKIALYPPWAAATVPPAKCPARATTPILAAARIKYKELSKNCATELWSAVLNDEGVGDVELKEVVGTM